MPNFVNYSPWTDAANAGRGLGDVLSQVLLQQPRQKAEFQMEQQRFPLEQALLQAQVNNQNFRPQYQQDILGLKQQQIGNQQQNQSNNLDLKKALLDLATQIQNRKVDIGQQNADTNTKRVTQGTLPSPSEVNTENNIVTKTLPQMGEAMYGGGNTNIPMSVVTAAQQVLSNPQNRGANPLDVLKPFVQPNVVTNEPSYGKSLLASILGSAAPQPSVTTNGAQFTIPQGMQQPSAIPQNTQGMIRVKSPTGQMGSIPAGQLQDAIQQGYQQIQ